jgi:predicted nucleic acid-binding protein
MVTYVLDSSAILRYLGDEAGAARVSEILKEHLAGRCEAIVSAPHWGEIAGITCKVHGRQAMELVLSRLSAFGLQVVAADAERSVRAALIKLEREIPYVDAFGVELAAEGRDRVFVTADFDFKAASRDVTIEFLPAKQRRVSPGATIRRRK